MLLVMIKTESRGCRSWRKAAIIYGFFIEFETQKHEDENMNQETGDSFSSENNLYSASLTWKNTATARI